MLKQLTGKRAMVTGGSRGIGRAICERLVAAGAEVAFCGRTEAHVDGATGSVVDLRDTQAISRWFAETKERWGGLDILINNAGLAVFDKVGSLTLDDWQLTIDTNLTAVFACCREAVPLMAGGGSVVNIGSLSARNAFPGGGAYCASKAGLLALSDAFMADYRAQGIRVSTVLPGSVNTEFSPRPQAADTSWKLAPEDVAEVVMTILCMPERALVSCVEIRPSQPPQKGL